ncbi:isocitrate dehydrogenase [Catalinimonas alkaloidigena]|uniref:Isocitrate dehydrogenase [NADP] n=1 Tax=Catalinimonas alkaloidigena TaxID=1075417 RepID=A0A1G9MV12_9BACT|nr:NADP-dependent isocitrate dehydrogenase [Catalinimonas alkaloidigena]SDL78110.1 isocitrate dehydrogenase [Catalinimonas alkaloidigena]
MSDKVKIVVANGDGIGPEIMDATLRILDAAGAPLDIATIEIGEKVYKQGVSAGIQADAWDLLRDRKVFLKAPITTPQGGGYKSLNVTTRKTLGLYANVRPCQSFHPYIVTRHPSMNLVIIRENEEDLYAGIEHQQTAEVVQCLKLISRPGCEKIVRYAFEYARAYGRKKVTCMTKDNIMKMSDGLFHRVFDEIGKEYPDINQEHWIIDIGSALIADTPERFDVIVTLNLYGDIISDIAAQVAGSVGLGGSANIGDQCAMFEAIHGSAPTIAGQNIANPSGLLNAAIMMLVHVNLPEVAAKINNAWLCTLEDGIHTADIFKMHVSEKKVGTREFADAVIERMGKLPKHFAPVSYSDAPKARVTEKQTVHQTKAKELIGIDLFLDWSNGAAQELGDRLAQVPQDGLKLLTITNRGVKAWPDDIPGKSFTDHWCCRFTRKDESAAVTKAQLMQLMQEVTDAGYDIVKTENLYYFDGVRGYSLGQGE